MFKSKFKRPKVKDFEKKHTTTLRIGVTYDSCGEIVNVYAHIDQDGKIMYTAVGHGTSNFFDTPEEAVRSIDEYA